MGLGGCRAGGRTTAAAPAARLPLPAPSHRSCTRLQHLQVQGLILVHQAPPTLLCVRHVGGRRPRNVCTNGGRVGRWWCEQAARGV